MKDLNSDLQLTEHLRAILRHSESINHLAAGLRVNGGGGLFDVLSKIEASARKAQTRINDLTGWDRP